MLNILVFPLLFLVFLGVGIAGLIFWIWAIVDCLKSDLNELDKIVWTLVIVTFNILGVIIYLIFVKTNKEYRGIRMKKGKRLYRSNRNRMIAGVCGGIGEYFGTDPTLIRLGWIILTLMGGSGLIAYIIAWIVIPEKK